MACAPTWRDTPIQHDLTLAVHPAGLPATKTAETPAMTVHHVMVQPVGIHHGKPAGIQDVVILGTKLLYVLVWHDRRDSGAVLLLMNPTGRRTKRPHSLTEVGYEPERVHLQSPALHRRLIEFQSRTAPCPMRTTHMLPGARRKGTFRTVHTILRWIGGLFRHDGGTGHARAIIGTQLTREGCDGSQDSARRRSAKTKRNTRTKTRGSKRRILRNRRKTVSKLL